MLASLISELDSLKKKAGVQTKPIRESAPHLARTLRRFRPTYDEREALREAITGIQVITKPSKIGRGEPPTADEWSAILGMLLNINGTGQTLSVRGKPTVFKMPSRVSTYYDCYTTTSSQFRTRVSSDAIRFLAEHLVRQTAKTMTNGDQDPTAQVELIASTLNFILAARGLASSKWPDDLITEIYLGLFAVAYEQVSRADFETLRQRIRRRLVLGPGELISLRDSDSSGASAQTTPPSDLKVAMIALAYAPPSTALENSVWRAAMADFVHRSPEGKDYIHATALALIALAQVDRNLLRASELEAIRTRAERIASDIRRADVNPYDIAVGAIALIDWGFVEIGHPQPVAAVETEQEQYATSQDVLPMLFRAVHAIEVSRVAHSKMQLTQTQVLTLLANIQTGLSVLEVTDDSRSIAQAMAACARLVVDRKEPLDLTEYVAGSLAKRELLFDDLGDSTRVLVSKSAIKYRGLIVALESDAREIERIPKRLSVLFKSENAIASIAIQRFGRGSSLIKHYVEEHEDRRNSFFANLDKGMICREIYSPDELRKYLLTGQHGQGVTLGSDELLQNLDTWETCISNYPNYIVALCSERIPFKYEIIDHRYVIFHETIGGNDRDRLNAIAIDDVSIASTFHDDFDTVWDRINPENRSLNATLAFISNIRNVTIQRK